MYCINNKFLIGNTCLCREKEKDQHGNEDESNVDEKRFISYEVITFIY